MQYELLKDVYLDGKVRSKGEVVEIKDQELADQLLGRQSIAKAEATKDSDPLENTPPVSEPELPAPTEIPVQPQPGEVIQPEKGQPSPEQVAETIQNLETISIQ